MTCKWTPEHIKDCYWAQGKKLLATCFVKYGELARILRKGTRFREYSYISWYWKGKGNKKRQGQHILTVSAMEYSELSFFARP